MITMTKCTRQNTCYDCDEERCWHHGKKEADCPKYRCDRPEHLQYHCTRCSFIDRFIKDMRKEYGYTGSK